jgi:hypothetical protein
MLMMLCAILGSFGWYTASTLFIVFVPPIHMFRHLRGAYQLNFIGALWRTIALLFIAFCSLTFFAVFVLRMSL